MNKIIYYVASSLDGFIAGPNDDVSLFPQGGNAVNKYLSDLNHFKTVIMGRRTYEFAYQYGMKPGEAAYPHMEHHIFSDNLLLENSAPNVHIEKLSLDRIKEIRLNSKTDVYLCGGGVFAGWLLDHGLIDQLILKLNPIILGDGVRIFGDSKTKAVWKLEESSVYDHGLQIMNYQFVR